MAYLIGVVVILLLPALLQGCGTPPYAAEQRTTVPCETPYVARLDAADQRDVRETLVAAAGNHEVTGLSATVAEAERGRWYDVPAAARRACTALEIGIFGRRRDGEAIIFTLGTIDDRPGELRIEPRPAPEVFAAEAWIGRFHERAALADELIDEFTRAMADLGRVPQLNRPPRGQPLVTGKATSNPG